MRRSIKFNAKIYWACVVSAYALGFVIPDGLTGLLYAMVWLGIFFLRVNWLQWRLRYLFNAAGCLALLATWPFFVRGDTNHPVFELARTSMYASVALFVTAVILLGWPWRPRAEQSPGLL